jgi:signal transduction histidine kinase/DNA-binding NarL/FixJ family response regulator
MSPGRILTSKNGIVILVAGGLLLLALVVAISALYSVNRAIAWVSHTYHVIAEVNRCSALVRFAETDQRGYLLFGREEYLENFEASKRELDERLELLARLLEDNPAQTASLEELRSLIEMRIADMDRLATLRRDSGSAQRAVEIFNSEAGLRVTGGIRDVANRMVRFENDLLEKRRSTLQAQLRSASVTAGITGAIALLMGAYTFTVMRRAVIALDREAELLRQKEHAERADREKSEFLANMSHEIRTPMNAVLGFADLLRGAVTTPKQRQYVDAINTSGRSLLSIINDILDLSKIEAGRIEIRLAPMSVRSVFDNVRTIFSQQAMERGLSLGFGLGENVPPGLLFDAPRLRQILFNVVGNALKFTNEGSVSVRAEGNLAHDDETKADLRITVSDTGIGIAPEHQEKVFEPFRQVGVGIDRKYGGTGLGLSITRRLTHALGGAVTLRSEPGVGTTFTFHFPRVAICPPPPEEAGRVAPEEDLDRIRPCLVLVADDVVLNRTLVEGYLEGTHHRLVHAVNGREAVQRAVDMHPDIVLMDIRMPDMSGVDALREIRSRPDLAGIPVVAVTASSMLAEENELRELFDGYIRKPFTRLVLYREMARLLPPAEAHPPEVGAEVAPASEVVSVEEPAHQTTPNHALVSDLQALARHRWPDLAQAPGFRETEAFARTLIELAEPVGCTLVVDFARRLLADIDNFDTDALEATLREFPDLVDRIESSASSPRAT